MAFKIDFIGIDNKNWRGDLLWGIGAGLFFVLMPVIIPGISIAIEQSILDEQIVRVILAPVIEEFMFRGVIFWLPAMLFGKLMKLGDIGIGMALLAQAAAFSFYHISAYGAGASAAFVGAFAFGIVAQVIALKSKNIVTPMIAHLIINGWLLAFGAGGFVIFG